MISVVVSGATGRLGRQIIGQLLAAEGVQLAAGLVPPGSQALGQDLGVLAGTSPIGRAASDDAHAEIQSGRVLIEAATRRAAMEHAAQAATVRAPMLIATTGFDRQERQKLESYAHQVPVLIAANLSLGIAVLSELVAQASRALPGYHLELLELHHAKKKDAPSGTAWLLAKAAAEARGQDIERDAILARAGDIGARGEREIGMQSVRGGDIIGDHTVYFIGATERIELTHRAQSRDAFAFGAVVAARFLADQARTPGLYSMRDVLGLQRVDSFFANTVLPGR